MRKGAAAAAWTLLAAALALTALYLRPGATYFRLAFSQAASRQAQRLEVARPDGAVNVNTADASQLDELPGIGEALAQRIIEERTLNGPFRYPEDLLCVKGIGEKTYQKLLDLICLE